MDAETREALERYHAHGEAMNDVLTLAKAFAAEHPADDDEPRDEPLTQAIMDEFNGTTSYKIWGLCRDHATLDVLDSGTRLSLVNIKTLGQLRRLVAALKGE